MKKLVVVTVLMEAGCALACPSGAVCVQPVVVPTASVPTAGAVTVVQRERQVGLLPVVGDAVAGVATAVFGSNRPITTVVAAVPQQTVVASGSSYAATIAALPIPTVGDLIPVQTKTKVFVPGRYVVVRSTYGELVQVWQPSHYETVIVNN